MSESPPCPQGLARQGRPRSAQPSCAGAAGALRPQRGALQGGDKVFPGCVSPSGFHSRLGGGGGGA